MAAYCSAASERRFTINQSVTTGERINLDAKEVREPTTLTDNLGERLQVESDEPCLYFCVTEQQKKHWQHSCDVCAVLPTHQPAFFFWFDLRCKAPLPEVSANYYRRKKRPSGRGAHGGTAQEGSGIFNASSTPVTSDAPPRCRTKR